MCIISKKDGVENGLNGTKYAQSELEHAHGGKHMCMWQGIGHKILNR